MPKPLIIDNGVEGLDMGARAVKAAATILGGGTLLGALALVGVGLKGGGLKDVVFTPQTPLWAGVLRALLLGLPMLGGIAMMLDSVRYRVRPGEVLAERWTYLRGFRELWWAFSPLWPGIALAAYAWREEAFVRPLPVGVTVSWWWALGVYLLVLGVTFFCTGMLVAVTETRFDDEGVRCGPGRFLEWENVGQALIGQRRIVLFHRASPGNPMRSVPRGDPAVEGELMRRLTERGVPIAEDVAARPPVLAALYLGAAAALGAGAWAVRKRGLAAEVWLAVGLLVAGSLVCATLDRLRGFQHLTRVRPMTMTAEAADAIEFASKLPTADRPAAEDWATRAKQNW